MLDRLKKILSDNTGISDIEISPETNLKNDLGLNSFDLAELAYVVEEEFDIEIPDRAIKDIKTVSDVMEMIKNNGVV